MSDETTRGGPAAPATDAERRGAPRYPAEFDLAAAIAGQPPRKLRCGSISQTGLFVRSVAVPAVGTAVAVEISLPYGTVRLSTTVRRVVVAEREGELSGFAVQVDRVDEGEEAWSGLVRQARLRAPKGS